MGLREVKAQRTRDAVVDAALDLFEGEGYEETTMEQIAEAAEISPSTLYRYFPSKELIALDPVARTVGSLGRALDDRPSAEPLDIALGHVIHAWLPADDADGQRSLVLRAIIDKSTGPRARLWDLWAQERSLLEEAIARRTGADPSELWVGVASHTVMMVLTMALDLWRSQVPRRPATEIADEVIRLLAEKGFPLPRLSR